jgi:6-pyruvoyltetrahydropterin/6-carboxytetrahydropterin synthase
LRSVLDGLNYRNLDEEPAFAGKNTTTEFLARAVFDRMREAIRTGAVGEAAREVTRVKVTLHESHAAWAAYEGELGP